MEEGAANRGERLELEAEYSSLKTTLQDFAGELRRQLHSLLERERIVLAVPIESRVKEWDSILLKLERKPIQLDSVKEISDLIGLRIIVLFQRDVAAVCDVLNSTFIVHEQENTQERLEESQFGYSSIHFLSLRTLMVFLKLNDRGPSN